MEVFYQPRLPNFRMEFRDSLTLRQKEQKKKKNHVTPYLKIVTLFLDLLQIRKIEILFLNHEILF